MEVDDLHMFVLNSLGFLESEMKSKNIILVTEKDTSMDKEWLPSPNKDKQVIDCALLT